MTVKKKAENQPVVAQGHHFYGTSAYNWATGSSRQEVIDKLAREAGTDAIKRNVKATGGLYCWTCRVELPQSAHYQISFFQPQGVPVSDFLEVNIVSVGGGVKLIENEGVNPLTDEGVIGFLANLREFNDAANQKEDGFAIKAARSALLKSFPQFGARS